MSLLWTDIGDWSDWSYKSSVTSCRLAAWWLSTHQRQYDAP